MSETYYWYVRPIGSYTNEQVGKALGPEEPVVFIEDPVTGRSVRAYECPYEVVAALQESKQTDRNVRYILFRKRGGGKVERWPPGKRQSRKLQEVADALEKHTGGSAART